MDTALASGGKVCKMQLGGWGIVDWRSNYAYVREIGKGEWVGAWVIAQVLLIHAL